MCDQQSFAMVHVSQNKFLPVKAISLEPFAGDDLRYQPTRGSIEHVSIIRCVTFLSSLLTDEGPCINHSK